MIDLVKLLKDVSKCTHLLVQATTDIISTSVFKEGKRFPIQHFILVNYNLLAVAWECLRPSQSHITEPMCMVLGKPDMKLRVRHFSMDSPCKTTFLCVRKKLRIIINTRSLTLRISNDECNNIIKILLTVWKSSQKRFKLCKADSFILFAEKLAPKTQWDKHAHISL